MDKIFSLKNISLDYKLPGDSSTDWHTLRALNDLTLDIYEGEFLAIVGANGSGKSSLGKLLAGLADEYSGEMCYRGEKITSYKRDRFKDVTMVLQEPQNQLLMPTVRKELSYPLENRKLPRDKINEIVKRQAGLFGLNDLMDNSPDELSGGQVTTLALASALIYDPQIIILDEPDSHFDSIRKSALNEIIEKEYRSKTLILITQYIDQAMTADRVVILDKGSVAAEGRPGQLLSDKKLLVEYGLDAGHIGREEGLRNREASVKRADATIDLKKVYYFYRRGMPVLTEINLKILKGQTTGIIGEMGSGKTTLGLLMAGLLKPVTGKIGIGGRSIGDYSERDLRRKITMTMQFPERALFKETVTADMAVGPENLGLADVEKIVNDKLGYFGIGHLRDRHPFSISGGEKRKAALGGILAMNTEIIIFDEPTAALDPKSYADFIDLIESMQDKTIIIISHDLALMRSTCSRIIELRQGRIISDQTGV